MMNNDFHNKRMHESQQLLKDALKNMRDAMKASIAITQQMLSSLPEGENKQMLKSEFANIQKSLKTQDAKSINQVNQRLLELVKKLR